MKTKLLKKWRWLYKFCRMKSKFFTQAGAYRSSLGDLFFCWYIKHHHLYEAIKLECDVLGVKPLWIWRENHPLHNKYAPIIQIQVKILKLSQQCNHFRLCIIVSISVD